MELPPLRLRHIATRVESYAIRVFHDVGVIEYPSLRECTRGAWVRQNEAGDLVSWSGRCQRQFSDSAPPGVAPAAIGMFVGDFIRAM